MTALVRGTLESDGKCFWLGAVHGYPGPKMHKYILWPYGYTARSNPLRVLDESGRVLARVGDQVNLGGGEVPMTNIEAMIASIPAPARRCLPIPCDPRDGCIVSPPVWVV
jgi:hypothetical protein